MGKKVNINVHHLTRVEGHGNIIVNSDNGRVEQVRWEVPEAPRFFEAMVRGQSYDDIQIIVSRICGICSISHSFTAIKAIEDAFGVEVSEDVDRLRNLLHYAEQLQSHTLHIGYLAVPDFFGKSSAVALASDAMEVVKKVISVHRLANEWSDLIGGRTTHPVTIVPGGFTVFPDEKQLRGLQELIKKAMPDFQAIAESVLEVSENIPQFERDTEYISLKQTDPARYTFYHGDITSTDIDGETIGRERWHKISNEYVVEQSTAKWTKWHRKSFMVGALARFNNNSDLLTEGAKKTAELFNLEKKCTNPYMNTIAQLVECVHICEDSIALIDELLSGGIKTERCKVTPKAGRGIGTTEAPRGLLIHEYEFDKNGKCTGADMCIPTNCNHANIQHDFEKIVPEILAEGEDAVRHKLEMLVRAYDPCISCSTHMLDVQFVK